jgi:hypothetical protein
MPAVLGRPWRWLPEGCRTTPVQHAGTVCWPRSAYRARATKVSDTQSAMKVLTWGDGRGRCVRWRLPRGEDCEKHAMSFVAQIRAENYGRLLA